MKWHRYRFKANYEDSRPVKFPPPGPTWETGLDGNGRYAIRIAYIPEKDPKIIKEFWPEATKIEWLDECDEIIYTSRFPKPDWWENDEE